MHRSMWTYAWDLLDIGYDAALGEIRDRAGANSVSLATSYHAGRFVQPRSPKRKVYFPEDGTIYFHPTPGALGGALRSSPRSPRSFLRAATCFASSCAGATRAG